MTRNVKRNTLTSARKRHPGAGCAQATHTLAGQGPEERRRTSEIDSRSAPQVVPSAGLGRTIRITITAITINVSSQDDVLQNSDSEGAPIKRSFIFPLQ